ncbi:MAG: hypothetical protein M3347_14060, partial [Armatimonadota bacterium]|nr:hypothetical protein [Armatimonadota bacterium]
PAGAGQVTLTGIPETLIERAARGVRNASGESLAALAPEFANALRPPASAALGGFAGSAPAPTGAPSTTTREEIPRLMLTAREVQGIVAALNAAATTGAARSNAAALIDVLRTRLELQRNDLRNAITWIEQAEQLAPAAAEVMLWRGIIAAGRAEEITLSSPARADLLAEAANLWTGALSAPALLSSRVSAVAETSTVANTGEATAISGVPRDLLRAWGGSATFAAAIMNVEPPRVAPIGGTQSGVVVRHFSDDPSLRLTLPTGALLARAGNAVGWRADEEEILTFPTAEYYVAYRRAAGLTQQQVPSPVGEFGDVIGTRIMMVSQFTLPVFLPPQQPGGQPRLVQFGTAVPAVLARMHAYILVNVLADGGTPPPDWMSLGLASLINLKVISEISNLGEQMQVLQQTAEAGGLLRPGQFRGAATREDTAGIAEAQAASMMSFFYNRFGAGPVVEAFQRLGAGESVDDALLATTGFNEQQFFEAWYRAQFGMGVGMPLR